MERRTVRKQCSGIFQITKNIITGLPGGHKTQLRESLNAIKSTVLTDREKEVLETCRQELRNGGEYDLSNLVYETYRGTNSAPNLF